MDDVIVIITVIVTVIILCEGLINIGTELHVEKYYSIICFHFIADGGSWERLFHNSNWMTLSWWWIAILFLKI